MKLLNQKLLIFVIFCLTSTLCMAEKISCPAVEIIQNATLTKIELENGAYFSNGNFHLLGRDWNIRMSFGNHTFQSHPSLSDVELYLKKVKLRIDYEDVACNYWYLCESKYSCDYAGEGVLVRART
jgi:hypothetical protein